MELGGIRWYKLFNNKGSMKENKLGRKYANTWSPPNRIRCKRNHNFATRRANKGVRKNAKLMIKVILTDEYSSPLTSG